MNFELTEEQAMLGEALTRFLADQYGFEQRRALRRTEPGWSQPVWEWLAGQGYLAAPFAEQDGGLGGGAVETMVIGEAFGRHLVAEPYLATVILAGTAFRLAEKAPIREKALPGILSGERTAAFCLDDAPTPTWAERTSSGWQLGGGKLNVIHGATADHLVVTAGGMEGMGLFLVDAAAVGLTRREYATFDGLRAADIQFSAVSATPLALGPDATTLIERVMQHGVAFVSAEAVGIMRRLLDLTVEHLKTRRQFGQALGDFQVLKHRAVDMLVASEQADSAKILAATMVDHPDGAERGKAFAAAKAIIGNAARTVGQAAVQLHGGIGVTDEHYVGWGMRRLTMIEMMFGDGDHHMEVLAELGGFLAAAE